MNIYAYMYVCMYKDTNASIRTQKEIHVCMAVCTYLYIIPTNVNDVEYLQFQCLFSYKTKLIPNRQIGDPTVRRTDGEAVKRLDDQTVNSKRTLLYFTGSNKQATQATRTALLLITLAYNQSIYTGVHFFRFLQSINTCIFFKDPPKISQQNKDRTNQSICYCISQNNLSLVYVRQVWQSVTSPT